MHYAPPTPKDTGYALPTSELHFAHYALHPPCILGKADYASVDCTLPTVRFTHYTLPPPTPKESVLSKTDYASVRSTLPTVHFTSPSLSKVD